MGTGIFDDRSTELVFNDYNPAVICPWIALERRDSEMCHSANSRVNNMQRMPHIGWQLKSYFLDPGDKAWLTDAADGHLSIASGATVAPHFEEEDSWVKPVLSGVTYDSGVSASGSPMITAKIPAGTDRSTLVLSSDQTGFPSPDPSGDPVTMDRVYTFPGAVDPWDALLFEFYAPASALLSRGTFGTAYFAGPAGVDAEGVADPDKEGTGHYALKLRGDGRAYLWEFLANNTWKERFSFQWNLNPSPVEYGYVSIAVIPRMWQDADGHYLGDRISFLPCSMSHTPGDYTLIERMVDIATLAIRMTAKDIPVYNAPRQKAKATTACPIRVDLARDCRASFMPSRHVYRPDGYLVDDYFALDQAINTGNDFFVYVEGVVPAGTSVAIEIHDESGSPLVASSSLTVVNTATGQTAYQSFTPTNRMRHVRMKVSLASDTNRFRTPTIVKYGIYRSQQYTTDNPIDLVTVPNRKAPPALPRTTIDSISITPQETDPGAENATFIVWDLTGELAFLGERDMTPVVCRSRYDDEPTNYANLFIGSVLTAHGDRMRYPDSNIYPAPNATRWTLTCVGEWASTSETLMPANKAWGTNPLTGAVWPVTDVIRFDAQLTYPPEMVDVPDIDVPLLTDDPSAYLQEANTKTVDAMQELANDYLGGYMLFDEAAGDRGMQRLLLQKHAPYNNLAIFEMDHPTILAGDGVPRLPHWAKSYPSTMSGDQEIQHTFIKAGTYNHWREKAEGNSVVVYGSAIGGDANAMGSADGGLVVQVAVNVKSFNFLGLGPGDDGYPDGSAPEFRNKHVPIRAVDFKLGSQKATDWKCRRIFEKACFSRFYLAFDAPLLLVTDVTDDKQTKPRRLRYYDPVQVRQSDGSLKQFLVVNCIPAYRKDGLQMARYVLVTQSNIDKIGAIDRQNSTLKQFLRAFGRAMGTNWQYGPPVSAQQKAGEHITTQLMGLPTPTSNPIQDLDPSSPTFGDFINMDDFEAIPFV